jgi:hypothetical protein
VSLFFDQKLKKNNTTKIIFILEYHIMHYFALSVENINILFGEDKKLSERDKFFGNFFEKFKHFINEQKCCFIYDEFDDIFDLTKSMTNI